MPVGQLAVERGRQRPPRAFGHGDAPQALAAGPLQRLQQVYGERDGLAAVQQHRDVVAAQDQR